MNNYIEKIRLVVKPVMQSLCALLCFDLRVTSARLLSPFDLQYSDADFIAFLKYRIRYNLLYQTLLLLQIRYVVFLG